MTNAFARITELHDEQCCLTNPCGRMLYRWLLRRRPAGMAQEFELKDFQDWSEFNRRRPRPYCLPWIWQAINELVNIGLLSIKKRYSRYCLSVVVHHPDVPDQSNVVEKKTFKNLKKTFKKQTSSAYNKRIHYIEDKEQTNTQPTHPVVINNQKQEEKEEINTKKTPNDHICNNLNKSNKQKFEITKKNNFSEPMLQYGKNLPESAKNVVVQPPTPPENENLSKEDQVLLNEVKTAGIHIHPKLAQFILKTTSDVVRDAVAVVKEAKAKGVLKNPAGLLVEAIKNSWKPNQNGFGDDKLTREFLEWYKRAIASGLVEDLPLNHLSRDRCNEPLVRLKEPDMFGAPYTLVPWRNLLHLLK